MGAVEQLVRLYNAGLTSVEVGEALGIDDGKVRYIVYRLRKDGADIPHHRRGKPKDADIPRKGRRCLQAVGCGALVADLAESYGVSERTLYRWMEMAKKGC